MSALRQAAMQALEAYDQHEPLAVVMEALRAALAEPVREPVAWYFEARHIDSAWAAAVTLKHPGPEGKYMRKVTPLYTAPPQRKPLTEGEIREMFFAELRALPSYPSAIEELPERLARAIERAHGIGEHS